MKHTPGPWRWSVPRMPKHRGSRWIIARGLFVAKVYGDTDYILDPKETDANARLIAAAPEMLAALEDVLIEDEWEDPFHQTGIDKAERRAEMLSLVRAAISKAKGGLE